MSAVALREFNPNLMRNVSGAVVESSARNHVDAALDIHEIEAMRLNVDDVVPPEMAEMAEPLVEKFQGALTSGDHLRLQKMTNHDWHAMRGAVNRVLNADLGPAVASREAIAKEKRMHLVLGALHGMVNNIHDRAMAANF